MPTFREVAENWLLVNSADKIDFNLIFSSIGDANIENVTSEMLSKFFIDLYDNVKLRGVVLSSYEKTISDIFQYAFEREYVSEKPIIEHRNGPVPNLFNKPDISKMQLLLSHENCTPTGTILRLAWLCGLMRNEITYLLWNQIDLHNYQLVLPSRKIPLDKDMALYLDTLYKTNSKYSEFVLISLRKTAPLAEQSVSALARKAMDNYGLNNIRLNDLRIDYIVRALKEYDIEYVSYISGVDIPALNQHYLPYLDEEVSRNENKAIITPSLRKALNDFMDKEDKSMVGLAVRFSWQMGIPISVLPYLTWNIIDFAKSIAIFNDRTVNIPDDFLKVLLDIKNSRDDSFDIIILNNIKKQPTDCYYIQKAVQQSLIRNGIIGITLPDLQHDYWYRHHSELREILNTYNSLEVSNELYSIPKNITLELIKPAEEALFDYLEDKVFADKKTLIKVLAITEQELSLLLKKCMENGKIVRVGFRYFLPNTITQRENQKSLILEYIKNRQPVSSTELSELLGLVERRQIYWVLTPMLKTGELLRINRNQYCLPDYLISMETA